ncbi:phosphatase PAP2 family protein [Bombilactobacillus thymidiniphilus]|uniref:phosphatase PAP2 family protein n=1 Tax=Bombilactobacillus thymidiniphilus TaxID=2923363 RepID=UPI0037C10B1A
MLLFLKNNQQRIFLLCSVLGNNLLNQVLKFNIQRPRPNIEHLTAASGFSFPSGHAMATASFALAICLIYSQITHKKLFFCLNSIFFCLIFISRPLLHVHYLSDVVAGSLLASANILLFYYFFGNRVKYNHS